MALCGNCRAWSKDFVMVGSFPTMAPLFYLQSSFLQWHPALPPPQILFCERHVWTFCLTTPQASWGDQNLKKHKAKWNKCVILRLLLDYDFVGLVCLLRRIPAALVSLGSWLCLSPGGGGHFSIFLNDCNTSRVCQDTSMHTCNFSIQKGFVGRIKRHSNLESSLHYIARLSQTAKQAESTLHHFCFVIVFSLNFLHFSHKNITVSKEPSYPLGWSLRSPF